jgi:hypothetical protein
VRCLLAAELLAACYGPKPPSGAPCDPAAPACPAGQTCQPVGVCSATAIPPPDAAVDAAVDAAPDAPPDAQALFAYPASISKCINPLATPPDPTACAAATGTTHAIRVDADDGMHPWDGFLRFDLDGAFAGCTVVAVQLVLTAPDVVNADSTNSGLVYENTTFTPC